MYGRMIIEFADKNLNIVTQASVGFESSSTESIDDFSASFQSIIDMSLLKVSAEAVSRFKKEIEIKNSNTAVVKLSKVEATNKKVEKKKGDLAVEKHTMTPAILKPDNVDA